jgi:hypothetical protein
MNNQIKVSGMLKNIKKFDQYGLMVVGQLTQRDEANKATFTIPIVTHSKIVADILQGLDNGKNPETGYTAEVVITGELNTKFDTRKGVDNADRKAPLTRIVISEVELVG